MTFPTPTIGTRLTFGQRELRRPSLRDDVEQLEELVLFESSRVDPKGRTYIDPGSTGIYIIPDGPLLYIISHLKGRDLCKMAQVSRKFYRLTEQHREYLYSEEDFGTLMVRSITGIFGSNLVSLIWWLARCHLERKCPSFVFEWASRKGHIEIVKLLLAANSPKDCSELALDWASYNGHTEIVKLLLAAKKPYTSLALDYASMNGHTEVVKLLLAAPHRSNGEIENYPQGSCPNTDCTTDALDQASRNGHTEIVKLLLVAGSPYSDCTKYALDWASLNGHTEIVRLLIAENKPCSVAALDNASCHGHIEVVKLLLTAPHRSNGEIENYPQGSSPYSDCTIWALNWASQHGHIKVVRLLIEANKPCSVAALNMASENGHTEIVKLLIEANKPCSEDALDWTSINGHTEIVKLLIEAPHCSNGAVENYPEGSSPYSDCTLSSSR